MKTRLAMRFLLAVFAFSFALPANAQTHWNQFRGPNGDGKSDAKGLAVEWNESTNVTWKTPIHGKAWSSPVIWGDQVWMTTATEDGKKMSAVCVDVDSGKIIHDILVLENEEPRFCHLQNSYASPTPIIEEGRLYVHFGSYGTTALNTKTGKKIWERRDLECNHWRAPGSSPIIHGKLLIAAYDGFDHQFVTAFDKESGETVWKKKRNIDYGTDNGDRMKAYSTAHVIRFNGRDELISPSAVATIAYNPHNGNELWKVYHGGMNAAPRPLFDGSRVFITGGDGPMSLIAVKPGGSGDVTKTHVEWGTSKSAPKRASQILVDGLLFMVNDSGVASCLEAKTGEIVWQERMEGGEYWASPLYAEGRIYCFSKEGKSPVFAAKREFELLAENQLDDGIWASPAVAGNAMFVRTRTHLYRIER